MKDDGQVLNLNSPGCVHHGVVLHELMHAIGFYHQQSASDRDDFVQIKWENIANGREHNFNKYNSSIVTDFGIPYDYNSVMHYSGKAFSKNGDVTIEPLVGAFAQKLHQIITILSNVTGQHCFNVVFFFFVLFSFNRRKTSNLASDKDSAKKTF